MQNNLTLDDMILQYSEYRVVDDETLNEPIRNDRNHRLQMLSKLLLIAGNLFEKYPESNLNFYKHRYELK
jgi:hypothetical protein